MSAYSLGTDRWIRARDGSEQEWNETMWSRLSDVERVLTYAFYVRCHCIAIRNNPKKFDGYLRDNLDVRNVFPKGTRICACRFGSENPDY